MAKLMLRLLIDILIERALLLTLNVRMVPSLCSLRLAVHPAWTAKPMIIACTDWSTGHRHLSLPAIPSTFVKSSLSISGNETQSRRVW
jgi:hypothetical protein